MTEGRLQRLQELFDACLELPPKEWARTLHARCADDASLAAEVLELLNRDARADTPPLTPLVPPVEEASLVKILKAGMDTRAVLARFEAERQALALMDHPGVARVLDAGETAAGRPYFVMELVSGESITGWCESHASTLRERLDLFIAVCRAVEHAHQKGVIHRDLKPSNILVTEAGGGPAPRVIDFGIAKATTGSLGGATSLTRPDEFLGTPEYMSPEQALTGGLDVDTRTDVYSLGVVLYRLLTGRLPFDPERLRRGGVEEVRRILGEEDPPRPSNSLRGTGGARTPPTALRDLKGDLDWIVLKAMDKERTRRYASPSALADDIERHLRHEPRWPARPEPPTGCESWCAGVAGWS